MRKIFIIILFTILFAPHISNAAVLSLSADKKTFTEQEEFLVQVFVDSDVSINAVEGLVKFPADLFTLKEVRDGNSSINFWVEKPASNKSGEIFFSGITTGGSSGPNRFLFSMVLQAKKVGNGEIVFTDVQILQNDGLGTKERTTTSSLALVVGKGAGGAQANLEIIDTLPPESFSPFIGRDTSIFDGAYFVVFSTVDKGVGVYHYEVKEGFFGDYVLAESPHLLNDQTLSKKIYVKAIDQSGNERTEEIKAQKPNRLFQSGLILGIILIIWILYSRKNRRKFFK